MRTNHKHSRRDGNTVKWFFEQSFVEAYQLRNKCHVRVSNWSSLFYIGKSFIKSQLLFVYKVGKANSSTSWNTLNAVDINFAVLFSCFLNKLYCIIEHTFDLLSDMILQVVLFISDFFIKIIGAIISSTIYNMSDSVLLHDFFILSYKITA